MTRPNFLLIITDQHRADHLGCYGNTVVKTPNLDTLAARGSRLDRFYVNCPICMPNRIAMMTGRTPSTNGSRHNGIPLSLDAVTYVDLLRAAGYSTALIGKSHLQDMAGRPMPKSETPDSDAMPPPEELSDASRERRVGPGYEAELGRLWRHDPDREIGLPYYGFDYVRFANGHGDQVHGHYNRWLLQRHNDPDSLRGKDNALPAPELEAPQAWRTALPEALYPTTYVADQTIEFLESHVDDGDDRPFFIQCSFPDPHHPFTPPGRYFDMYDPGDMPVPESFHAVGENEHPFLQRLREQAMRGAADDGGPRPFAITDEKALRQIIALTYGMITMVDDCVGRIMDTLQRLGLDENTVVIFVSDHGDFMGDHGLMLKHGLHYEGVLRVPFIWSDPQRNGPDPDTLACSIDIGATILSRAGLAPANGNQGIDLLANPDQSGLSRRRGIIVEEDELGAHLGASEGLRTRTFITGRWRMTIWDEFAGGELFDRETDPLELHNLWDSLEHREQKSQLIEEMLREFVRLGDTAPLAVHIA